MAVQPPLGTRRRDGRDGPLRLRLRQHRQPHLVGGERRDELLHGKQPQPVRVGRARRPRRAADTIPLRRRRQHDGRREVLLRLRRGEPSRLGDFRITYQRRNPRAERLRPPQQANPQDRPAASFHPRAAVAGRCARMGDAGDTHVRLGRQQHRAGEGRD